MIEIDEEVELDTLRANHTEVHPDDLEGITEQLYAQMMGWA